MNYNSEVLKQINLFGPNEVIASRKLYIEKLRSVPELTFFKVLERMVKDNKLIRISKGIYCRPKETRFGILRSCENEIVAYYTGGNNRVGMVVGYKLYNKYGISTQISKRTELYSNQISENKKVIQNIVITRANIMFSAPVVKAIEAFEILQKYNEIEDLNHENLRAYLKQYAHHYNDSAANQVLTHMHYKKRTIAFLEKILENYEVENTLHYYLSKTSIYKIPAMERIYEPA
ncbi:MAG: DUF6088 family protein [Saccharofermentanales bacterium]